MSVYFLLHIDNLKKKKKSPSSKVKNALKFVFSNDNKRKRDHGPKHQFR